MEGAAKGFLFSEERLFLFYYFFSFLFSFTDKEKMYDFFYSLKADPPKGSYFFDGFEVMRWPLSEDLRESKHLTLVLVL